MNEKKYYQTPSVRIVLLSGENNFLASGTGEDANPGDGSWIYDDEI